ncbi:uncharacterized protein Fot_29209 [Forsythia ovata]|uniref:Uncharacterized protein n=1 Tax=Forsythia ovata TaxID=205694 RepID=A0ABD1TRQ8_9LAMI
MVAAICYVWLLENRMKADKERGDGDRSSFELIIPVMNTRREKMWKQRQVAWLFEHVGLDATALFFSNEVDLETLMMAKKLSMLVVSEDILRTNSEYKLLCLFIASLAGILLDTQNLNLSPKLSVTRDAEAVQLLLGGLAPNYRNTLFDQLMQDLIDNSFLEFCATAMGSPSAKVSWFSF